MAAYFPEVSKVVYEGPKSKNPLAFKHYNPEEMIEGQSMKDLFRFSVAYWHTFRGTGSDPFGSATLSRPWDDGSNSVANALKRVDVAFEFMSKLQAPFYCWHDRDVAPEGSNLLLADVGAHAGADGKEPHDAVFTPPYTLVPEPAADAWPRVLERAGVGGRWRLPLSVD